MSNVINFKKRNGRSMEPLQLDKIHNMVEEACKGVAGVSASQVEIQSGIQFYDGITTGEIQEKLIRSASDLKDYHHTKVSEPQTTGIEEIHDLPTYQIQTPPQKQLEALKILVDNDVKIKKKDMAEKAEESEIITINAQTGNHSQARFASLDKNIIAPLENQWGYVRTEKVGRNRWIHLTDEGRWAAEFLI